MRTSLPHYPWIWSLLLGLIALFPSLSKGQDPQFSQAYSNPSFLNPAMVAFHSPISLSLNHRAIRINEQAKFKTFSTNFEYHIPKTKSAVALQFLSDEQGRNQLANRSISAYYSYKLQLNRRLNIRFGMQGIMGERSLNASELVFEDQIRNNQIQGSSAELINSIDQHYLSLSSGVLLEGKRFFAGFSIHHLNQDPNNFNSDVLGYAAERKYSFNAAYRLMGNSKHISFIPSVIYLKQGEFEQLSLGNYFQINYFTAGAWYRLDQAFIASIGIQHKNFNFGYSVDISTEEIQNVWAHEISISIHLDNKKRDLQYSGWTDICPTF